MQAKRRRGASAEPTVGRTGRSRRTAPKHVEVISEESEEEEPQVRAEEPPPKIAKKRDVRNPFLNAVSWLFINLSTFSYSRRLLDLPDGFLRR